MSTLLQKLKNRLERDKDLPVSVRMRDDALAAVRYLSHATAARITLRDCNSVGSWARTSGGSPHIDNRGRIVVGSHVVLASIFSPVQLATGPSGVIEIGSGSSINFGTQIVARRLVRLGDDVSVGPYCVISDETLDPDALDAVSGLPIEIGAGAWLAGRVTVLPGASIGAGSVITAGSIVSGVIPPGVIAGGNPARVLRSLHESSAANTNALPEAALPDPLATPPRLPADASAPQGSRKKSTGKSSPYLVKATLPSEPVLNQTGTIRVDGPRQKGLLLSDFTIDDLALELNEPIAAPLLEVEVAPFGQVVPTLLNLQAVTEPPALVVAWARAESVVPSFARVLAFESVAESELLAEVDAYASLIASSTARVRCVVVPTFTLPAHNRGWGLMDGKKGGATRALYAMNLRLMERLGEHPHVHVLNAQRWIEASGKSGHSAKLWYMGKIPFHREVFAEAAKEVRAALHAVAGGARKLLVLDLDDTLWGGIVGDAGWENLRLGGHDALGESFVDFQRALKNLKRRGILLALCSKNEESVALDAIRKHPEMVLREDDFVAYRINWQDKARNIAEIATELNLGLQSVVFIDDNPVERGRVREALPEVLVPEWPEDKLLYVSALQSLHCFDAPALSEEDAARSEMYVAEKKRTSLVSQVGSIEEWLSSLGVRIDAERLDAVNVARAAQLLNKTNQLNLATRRLTQSELEAWAADPSRDLWVVHVSDRFGDSGLTGLVSIEARGDTAHIVDFLLSCRVMGRKVEEVLVHIAVESAQKRGLSRVEAQFLQTAKNKPCQDFWKRSGLTEQAGDRFVWDASRAYDKPAALTLTFR